MRKSMLTICCVLLASSFALADWDVGDGHKMHFPQMPDPFGWDVSMVDEDVYSRTLADDWKCSQSGPVTGMHFWASWLRDDPDNIAWISATIYDDDPVGLPGLRPDNQYSMPGNKMWQHVFLPGDWTEGVWGTGDQGWYDPQTGQVILNDHQLIFQYNLPVPEAEAFPQDVGQIYWLSLSVRRESPPGTGMAIGWKSSLDHWNDNAVYVDMVGQVQPIRWMMLVDPSGTGEPLDLAFVITPEPGTLLLLLGGVALLRRRR